MPLRLVAVSLLLGVLADASAPTSGAAANAPASAPASATSRASGAAAPAAPSPVARVNGVVIDSNALAKETERAIAERARSGEREAADPAKLRSEVLQRLVSLELLAQAAAAARVDPTEAAVQAEVDKMRAQFGDSARMDEFLKKQGTTLEAMKGEIRRMLAVRLWLEREVESKVPAVSEAETRKFYESNPTSFRKPEAVRVSHILFRSAAGAAPAAKVPQRKKAEAALARLQRNEDFAAVAKEVSEDQVTSAQGGDMGEFVKGSIGGAFEEAAFRLDKGQTSGIVETQLGFHIIRVADKIPAGALYPFAQVKDELGQVMLEQRRQEKLKSVLDAMRATAKIEIL